MSRMRAPRLPRHPDKPVVAAKRGFCDRCLKRIRPGQNIECAKPFHGWLHVGCGIAYPDRPKVVHAVNRGDLVLH